VITPTQRKTAQAIVNVFETGSVSGDYGNVTLIAGDTGHLTFGRSQTTLGSGNLADLIERYCDNAGARFAPALRSFLPRFVARDLTLDGEKHLHNVLRSTADDPVMRETQDAFFDNVYWRPAERAASQLRLTTPLGTAVVYDSKVHGSWERIRDRVVETVGTVATVGEEQWIARYVATRHDWLSTHPRKDLRATAYRTEALGRLVDQNRWGLDLPLVVRGAEISMTTLNATPVGCFDGPQPGSRKLALQTPLARGLDVRLLQLGLSAAGADIRADGVFGQGTAGHVRDFQAAQGLSATGVADPDLIVRLIA
jgi:chitosanase